MKRYGLISCVIIALFSVFTLNGCSSEETDSDTITLRVANCEEYIDIGEEGNIIDLENGTVINAENAIYEDFEDWYYEKYGQKVKVLYSTYGTNEDLYNQMTIGDVYDLACPSEYMIMKMMREGLLQPYSEEFKDPSIEDNYYAKGVSPFIKDTFSELSINGESLDNYAAGYMWGTLGLVYNPELVSEEDASSFNILLDKNYSKRITIKDSVRDTYFAALTICYYDEITDPSFISDPNYRANLSDVLNRTDVETVNRIEEILSEAKDNVYAFETDAGKSDLITGKVVANAQWSGDAVYTMDQAEEDEVYLCYKTPEEGANLWFDGWVMLKKGISEDTRKQQAAEAFLNYISMPESVIRNMDYIGYTSCISGGDSDLIFEYLDYNYGAEEDEEDVVDYPLGYFFGGDDMEDADEVYCLSVPKEQLNRQLSAQYPSRETIEKTVVMRCFEDEDNERINRMWTNVRCFDLKSIFD